MQNYKGPLYDEEYQRFQEKLTELNTRLKETSIYSKDLETIMNDFKVEMDNSFNCIFYAGCATTGNKVIELLTKKDI